MPSVTYIMVSIDKSTRLWVEDLGEVVRLDIDEIEIYMPKERVEELISLLKNPCGSD